MSFSTVTHITFGVNKHFFDFEGWRRIFTDSSNKIDISIPKFRAICKSRKGESGNGMKGTMGMQESG